MSRSKRVLIMLTGPNAPQFDPTVALLTALVPLGLEAFKRRKQRRELMPFAPNASGVVDVPGVGAVSATEVAAVRTELAQAGVTDADILQEVRRELARQHITYATIGQLAGYSAETVRAQLTGRRTIALGTAETITSLLRLDATSPVEPSLTEVAMRRAYAAADLATLEEPQMQAVELLTKLAESTHLQFETEQNHKPRKPVRLHGNGSLGSMFYDPGSRSRVEAEPSWRSVPPDPTTVETVHQLHATMVELRDWAGGPSLRKLAARSPGLSHSTLNDMFHRTDRLPRNELLREYVRACGAGSEWPRWDLAWQRLQKEKYAHAA